MTSFVFPVINYEVTIVTGDVTFAGTNATVFIQIYGDKGKTEVIALESRSNNYERDTTEIFKVPGFFCSKMHLSGPLRMVNTMCCHSLN